jgi:16S rRNA (guanine966-N2)-methyltransferase
MTRIISGFAGSRELKVPKSGTRPTSDRVREAIFSALEARDVIEGARVLDLFAGSGALALEALSRGAVSVTMVEKNPQAGSLLRENAELVRGAGKLDMLSTRVVIASVAAYLGNPQSELFDIVFIDPPYELSDSEVSHALGLLVSHLADGAEVVLERSTRTGMPDLPASLVLDKSKAYGETTIHWISRD